MGRTSKKKLLDPRRLRSSKNNSASTSIQSTGNQNSNISRKGNSKNKPPKTESKYVELEKSSQFDRPATRFQSKTQPTPKVSSHGKTKSNYVCEKQNISLKKTMKSEPKTASSPSTSRLDSDIDLNHDFFIRRKRLRSEVDKDGLWEGLPTMLRYSKRTEQCEKTVLNVDLNCKNSKSIDSLRQNQANYSTETTSKAGSRYRTRQSSLHSGDSQGFFTQTQPFAFEHSNEFETVQLKVSEQTNKSKSNVSENISEAREKIKAKNKRKTAPSQKNLQMKSLFKELFGSDSISDTSSSGNETKSLKDVVVTRRSNTEPEENSLEKNARKLDNLLYGDSKKVQSENILKAEMKIDKEDNSDVSSSPPVYTQNCTTSSSCSSCLKDCNCRIIETSLSETSTNSNGKTDITNQLRNTGTTIMAENGSETALTSSSPLDPVVSQQYGDDIFDQASESATFSTEKETSFSSCSSTGSKITEKQEPRASVMRIFNPSISESRLYGDYSALSCIPGSEYSLHQSVSIHVSSSTSDTDISHSSSVYPVNSADTTQQTSSSHQKTFVGECSTQSCLPESVYSPKNASIMSIPSDESQCDITVKGRPNNGVNRTHLTSDERRFSSLMPESVYSQGNESISCDSEEGGFCDPKPVNRTSFANDRSFVVECSTESLLPQSVYSPRTMSNVCLQSSDEGSVMDLDTSTIVDGKLLGGECSKQNLLSEHTCSPRKESNVTLQPSQDYRVSKPDIKLVDHIDGKLSGIDCTKYSDLSESELSSSTVSNASLQSSEYDTSYEPGNSSEDQATLTPIDECKNQYTCNSFDCEITEKRCLDISKVISSLTSSSSNTNSSSQSDVNYLGKKTRIELFSEKVDSLPSIEDTEIDSDESNRLIIDLKEILDDPVNKNQSFQSEGTTNRALTEEELLESKSLLECFEDKLLETESFPHQNTVVNEDIIKEDNFETTGKKSSINNLNVHNAICPELSSDSKSYSITLERQELVNTKELRSCSRPHRKKFDTEKRKNSTSSPSNYSKETNKTTAKSTGESESKCSNEKSKKQKSKKADQIDSTSNVKKQSTPKKKREQSNTKSKSKQETLSKRKNTKKDKISENIKLESTSLIESSQSEQLSLNEHPDKTPTNLEIKKKSCKKKDKKNTTISNSMPISNDNVVKQSLIKTQNQTPPSESRRKHDRGNFSQVLSNESLEVHAKTLWCSDNRWTFCKQLRCNDSDGIEEAMNKQWEFISPKVKLKYFSRARYALLDEDKHSMRRGSTSTEKVCKKEDDDYIVYNEALRRTAPVPAPVKNRSDMDRFIRLKPNKQRDILKRWLKFYQKMLSRRDYSNFLIDFEQALYRSRLDDLKASSTHQLKSNDVELNHRRILFECMKRIKPQIITNCSEKYLNRRTELDKQYSDVVWALLDNDSSNLVPGYRSNRLEDTLKDLLELEEGGHVDVRGQAVQTESYTCVLNDLNTNEQPIDDIQNTDLLSNIPEVQNLDLYEQILENLASHKELISITMDDFSEIIGSELQCRNISAMQHGDAESNTPEPLDQLHSHDVIESNIREILHQEAIDAFIRSNESSTRSCCDLDSPSCILSTWIAAEYNSLPNILASTSNNDDSS